MPAYISGVTNRTRQQDSIFALSFRLGNAFVGRGNSRGRIFFHWHVTHRYARSGFEEHSSMFLDNKSLCRTSAQQIYSRIVRFKWFALLYCAYNQSKRAVINFAIENILSLKRVKRKSHSARWVPGFQNVFSNNNSYWL